MKLSKIEKFLNKNCFYIFLVLLFLVISYVGHKNNPTVKEHFTSKTKRKFRRNIKSFKQGHNKKVEKIERKIEKFTKKNSKKLKTGIDKRYNKVTDGFSKRFKKVRNAIKLF
tara:strand:+ start:208 stop:543 length:336 start_codon:yes stop_codon:yes gene_type:complete